MVPKKKPFAVLMIHGVGTPPPPTMPRERERLMAEGDKHGASSDRLSQFLKRNRKGK